MEFNKFFSRIVDLERLIARFEKKRGDGAISELERAILAESRLHLETARALSLATGRGQGTLREQVQFADAIIRGSVEIDKLYHPEVDPNEGWVEYEKFDYDGDGNREYLIDSQLLRLYMREDGTIIEFDYKPRKIELTNWKIGSPRFGLCLDAAFVPADLKSGAELRRYFSAGLADTGRVIRAPLQLKKTPGVLELRFFQALTPNCTLVKNFTFRGGIGAHLANSTTGFQFEMWLEGESPDTKNHALALSWHVLPSALESRATNLTPLLCFGGVAEQRFGFEQETLITTNEAPGGLFGARVVDGIDDFIYEIRASKALEKILFVPRYGTVPALIDSVETLDYHGSSIYFVLPLNFVRDEDRTTTIFVSIV